MLVVLSLAIGIPHLEEPAALSLAPKTHETPAQQQADGDVHEGHHPLKKMKKRMLAQESARELETARENNATKLQEARENNTRKLELHLATGTLLPPGNQPTNQGLAWLYYTTQRTALHGEYVGGVK